VSNPRTDDTGYYPDTAIRGNTFIRQYECKTLSGTPIDLTGYVVRWRAVYGDHTLEKSTAEGNLTVSSPSTGVINLSLTPEETRLIPAGENMKYEMEIVAPDNMQRTILWGDLVGRGGVSLD
jgi:hypothetical protein